MTDLVLLALLTLGVARLCVLMVDDKITEFFRVWVKNKLGADHLITFGVNCPWCWSIWFAFGAVFLTFPASDLRQVWINALTSLAVSYTASKLADW